MIEPIEENRYTKKIRYVSDRRSPDVRVRTKRCALCGTPREEMKGKRLALHLPECEGNT